MSSYHENTFLIIVLHCFSCIVHCIVYKTCNDKNALCRFLDPAVRDEQPWQSSKYVYFFYYSKKQYKIEKLKEIYFLKHLIAFSTLRNPTSFFFFFQRNPQAFCAVRQTTTMPNPLEKSAEMAAKPPPAPPKITAAVVRTAPWCLFTPTLSFVSPSPPHPQYFI